MQVSKTQWSEQEMVVAKAALEAAYKRETASIVSSVREAAREVSHIEDLWQLNDFLSARRFDIEGKYDDRAAEILFVLAKLLKEGWLTTEDLEGIDPDKLTKLKALTKIL